MSDVRRDEFAEATVSNLFAHALGLAEVEADDDFFSLGGTSGQAVSLTAALGDAVGTAVRLRWLYENPTPSGLFEVLRQKIEQVR